MKLETKIIHAGMTPDPSTGAVMIPIYQTSTYVQTAPGQHKGYEYARSQNPTRFAVEEAFAQIENGKYGLAFSSGVAATDAVIKLLAPGDEVIAANDMYGGTYRLFSKIFEKFGTIASAKVAIDKETGKSRGFGFVDMPDRTEAKDAMDSLNEISLGKKPLVIKEAEERSGPPPNRGGGGNSGGGGGYRGGGNSGGGGYDSR